MDFLQILTPFLLASIGGLYTEYSGTTNVAIEGYITLTAFIFITITKLSGSIYLGVVLALIIIAIISYIHSTLTIKLKANPIITGLAINIGFLGLISALTFRIFNTKGLLLLSNQGAINTTPIVIIALLSPIITILVLGYTRYGLRLKARGYNKNILLYSNIKPDFYRTSSFIISGLLSGLAGIFLSMELRSYIPNISAGRGWIALVIIFLGRKRPLGILLGCTVFTLTQILSNVGQNKLIPSDIILASPYIITLIALVLTSRKKPSNQ